MQVTPQSKSRAVIWIDHDKALIVAAKGNRFVKQKVIHSSLDQQLHEVTHHKHPLHNDAHRLEILKHFYKTILLHLRGIDRILLVGPAQAKYELGRQIERHKGFKGKIESIESADKMTAHELISYAERYWVNNDSTDDESPSLGTYST